MKNFLLLGNVKDLQTGVYIVESIESLGHTVEFIDIRNIVNKLGNHPGQVEILKQIDKLQKSPDIIIVLKGREITYETLNKIKTKFKNAIFTNWFFDVLFGYDKIWDAHAFFPTLKLYDFYFCSLRGVVDKLRDRGFKNVYYLGEACFPPLHGEQYMNNFQRRKYGSDVAFCGSIGFSLQHANRIPILQKIINAGCNTKIWGEIAGKKTLIPIELLNCHQNAAVINERHSMVCQSSLINIGIDQMPELDMSFSARVYRILCAGGLYLSTATKGLDNIFILNKEGEEITNKQDIVVFYNEDDLINKIDFLLENEDIRESIAKNGKEKVKKYTFKYRIKEMIGVIENEYNEMRTSK